MIDLKQQWPFNYKDNNWFHATSRCHQTFFVSVLRWQTRSVAEMTNCTFKTWDIRFLYQISGLKLHHDGVISLCSQENKASQSQEKIMEEIITRPLRPEIMFLCDTSCWNNYSATPLLQGSRWLLISGCKMFHFLMFCQQLIKSNWWHILVLIN